MSRSDEIADKVRSKLLRGILPRDEPVKVYGGHGRGEPCMACDSPIQSAQIVYELEMPDGARIEMHLGCHGLWLAERIRRGWGPAPS